MSGPLTDEDAGAGAVGPAGVDDADRVDGPTVEVSASRVAEVGGLEVRRALPQRARRTVGAWCFADHFGPMEPSGVGAMEIGPHPHIGLQTVTWLVDGEVVHHDSLGSEQSIRPGQLNLMTAGHGIAHAEETPASYAGPMHGVQLWVALPDATRSGPPAFEHHADLPGIEVGSAQVTVMLGSLHGVTSPARTDTALVGAELAVRPGRATLGLESTFEHAVVVLSGDLEVDGTTVEPGHLAYVGRGRDELPLAATATTRALLLGGEPFDGPIMMWWNFVARTRDEMIEAVAAWDEASDRFGPVRSMLPRIPAPRFLR